MPLSFRALGGDILWRCVPIEPVQALALVDEYRDELLAARVARDETAINHVADLLGQLSDALEGAAPWARAGGR
jgi:hypothetical protein